LTLTPKKARQALCGWLYSKQEEQQLADARGRSGMQRTALREARELKGWTVEEAAE
jgi:hypothetical protein